MTPAPTFGLSHISLAVADLDRTLEFYGRVFGVREYYRDACCLQVQGPGPHDVLGFELKPKAAGKRGGVEHFGFRLREPEDLDGILKEALAAGGKLIRRGEFAPGMPFAYVRDPDGYEIEIWFE